MKLVLTCEHAGNVVPSNLEDVFAGAGDELNSHRGFDPGALDLFYQLRSLAAYSEFHVVSRLVVEVNRSLQHPQLFSGFTKQLSLEQKNQIIATFYRPYRDTVEKNIQKFVEEGEKVLHLSVHTFTPQLHGETRNNDIGLLFDPAKQEEKEFCRKFRNQLQLIAPQLMVRFNYPYLGIADGFTKALRKKFPGRYSGIELEINQKHVDKNLMHIGLKTDILKALQDFID